MRAVDAMMECLKAEGVDAVFGIPGGANLPTYDALYDAGIRNILCRHEQGAGHAAEGYAKASGKVGVALATSGPGATNLVTPIADAMLDSVPTVFITGQVRTDLIGHRRLPGGRHDRHHDAGRQALVPGAGPARDPAPDPRGLPRRPHRAAGAGAGRRPAGPLARRHPVRPERGPEGRPARLQELRRGQRQADPARREGARERAAPDHLRRRRRRQRQRRRGADRARGDGRLPDHLHADGPRRLPGAARPVARDARHARHPHRELRDGQRRPDRRGRRALRRPHHRQAAPSSRREAKFVHIDIDPAEISKNVPAHIPIVGDCKRILPKLTAEYRALEADRSRMDEWWQQLRRWQDEWPLQVRALQGGRDPAAADDRRRCTR